MYISIHLSNILVTPILFGSFPIWAWKKGRKMLRVLINGSTITKDQFLKLFYFFKFSIIGCISRITNALFLHAKGQIVKQ